MQTAVRNTAHSLGRPDSKTEATVSKDAKNQNPRTLLWGWEVVRPLWKTAWQFLKPSLPRDLLTRHVPPWCMPKARPPNTAMTHGSLIHGNRNVEAAQMSVVDKQATCGPAEQRTVFQP